MDYSTAAKFFLPFVVPICLWVSYTDLKHMKIRNYAVLALMAVFFVVGLFTIPIETFAWRWSHFVVVLLIGYLMNMVDGVGAGDAKFAAAMAPYIAFNDIGATLGLFCACLIVIVILHRILRRIGAVRRALPEWQSFSHRQFPMGVVLTSTLLIYLVHAATKVG